jgi:hypothetical protein
VKPRALDGEVGEFGEAIFASLLSVGDEDVSDTFSDRPVRGSPRVGERRGLGLWIGCRPGRPHCGLLVAPAFSATRTACFGNVVSAGALEARSRGVTTLLPPCSGSGSWSEIRPAQRTRNLPRGVLGSACSVNGRAARKRPRPGTGMEVPMRGKRNSEGRGGQERTPAGGVDSFAIRDEGGQVVEIVEVDEDGDAIARTYAVRQDDEQDREGDR